MLSALFDFSFSEFVTVRLIKLLYAIMLVGAGLFAIITGFGMMSASTGLLGNVLGLLAIPTLFFVGAFLARIYCELVIALFRIAESSAEISRNTRPTTEDRAKFF